MTPAAFPEVFPKIETERLTLEGISTDHADGVYRNFSDPEMMRFLMDPIAGLEIAVEFIEEFQNEFATGAGLTWAIVDRASGEFLGTISYSVGEASVGDVGFDIWKDRWGRGLMTEALVAVVDWGFSRLGSPMIEAHTLTSNSRAIRVLERVGFVTDEVRRNSTVVAGVPQDEIFFSITRPA